MKIPNIHYATLIRTKGNRGYVFNDHVCLVCELSIHNEIIKVLRTGCASEVQLLVHKSVEITLMIPLMDYYKGNWLMMKASYTKTKKFYIVLQRGSRIVRLSLKPSFLNYDTEIVDAEECLRPFYLPGKLNMPKYCTLEKYIELMEHTHLLSDNKPHYISEKNDYNIVA